jgi:hypothetical protein
VDVHGIDLREDHPPDVALIVDNRFQGFEVVAGRVAA